MTTTTRSTTAAPETAPIPDATLDALIELARDELGSGADTWDLGVLDGYSNDLVEIRFGGGRTLIVKRARHDWAAPRFAAARRASALLRERASLLAPAPLELPDDVDERPIEAYWRIAAPTLRELWPSLDAEQRSRALQSLGALIRRIHGIRLAGHGRLPEAERNAAPLEGFLDEDLTGRLRPAVTGEWPEGLRSLERLIARVPMIVERMDAEAPRLVHSDLHMGNVLCETGEDGTVDCVGVLDLESAFAGPAEVDLANTEVMHGPLFGAPLAPREHERIREGYDDSVDAVALAFFRAYHHVNLGFHAALIGNHEHARHIAHAVEADVAALERGGARPGTRPGAS